MKKEQKKDMAQGLAAALFVAGVAAAVHGLGMWWRPGAWMAGGGIPALAAMAWLRASVKDESSRGGR